MAGVIDTLKNAIGKPGRKIYPTERREPRWSGFSLKDKLEAIVADKRLANREQRVQQAAVWFQMCLYYSGRQNIELNATGSAFDIYEEDDRYIENQFRRDVDTVKQILNKMEGDVVVRPASTQPKDLATARVADPVLSLQRDQIGYDRLLDTKSLYKCLMGNAFIFTDYVTDKKYGSIVTPKYGYQEMPGDDGEPMLTKVVQGYETRPKGQQVATVCSPLEVNCPNDVRPFTQVPYLQWISRQDIELLNYLYPGINIRDGMGPTHEDPSQEYIAHLASLAGNLTGAAYGTAETTGKKAELVRSWLQPCCFQGDKELEREFPDGAHVTTINGKVVDHYNEDLTARWTHEVLIPMPHSLLGDGLYDSIPPQDQINEMDSLLIQHMRYQTVGHKVYDSNVIDPKDVVNDPKNGWIPGKPGLDKNITQCVTNLAPGALSGDVPAWRLSVRESMQDMSNAYDPVGGKSLGANTPYSQSVFLTERAQSRWQGSLSYNRPEMIRFHRQLLTDAKQPGREFHKAIQDNTGSWSFREFTTSDLQGEVDIILSNADFKPKGRAEQVQGLQMLVELMPIIGLLPPKQKLRVEEMLGLPPDANPTSAQISRAYRIIERLKKGETVTPLPLVDDAQAQVPVFLDFLVSEDGEAVGEQTPEIYANIYTYAITLTQMGLMALQSPVGQIIAPQQQKQLPTGASQENGEKKPAGGQPGQPGGGPNSAAQPTAQSPSQPAAPVAVPSAV